MYNCIRILFRLSKGIDKFLAGITTKPEVPSKKDDPIPVLSAGNLQQGTSGVDVKQEDACEPGALILLSFLFFVREC